MSMFGCSASKSAIRSNPVATAEEDRLNTQ
jgi:hypothetical protein